jgi:hypothetical protein
MTELPVLVDMNSRNLDGLPCCGIMNPAHEGRQRKSCWIENNLAKGLRARTLVTGKRPCGYIEYLPGEYAWRGVDAAGYLFIHCIWTFHQPNKQKGLGGLMLEACLKDAADAGMSGVAVVARDGPWLAGGGLFLEKGFAVVDTAPPDYQLLVKKLNPSAANPAFRRDWERKLKKYSRGLTIIRSNQCPYVVKFAGEIARAAEEDYGMKPRVVDLRSYRDAQNAPTPYAVFAVIYNGQVLADHQISLTRFRNIMRKLRNAS